MKKTNVSLSIERSIVSDSNVSNYAASSNKEEVAAVVDVNRVVKTEEPILAKESSCSTASVIEMTRQPIITNSSFAIEEEDEEVRTTLDNGLRLPSNEKVEVNYSIGDSARSASINQTIITDAKAQSSYNTEDKEAKAEVVIEENVNTRTEDVEQLMGEL